MNRQDLVQPSPSAPGEGNLYPNITSRDEMALYSPLHQAYLSVGTSSENKNETINTSNYKINQLIQYHKFLKDEEKERNRLKKSYSKLGKSIVGAEFVMTALEIALTAGSIALPFLVPITTLSCLGLTIGSVSAKSAWAILGQKKNKHSEVELLAKSKLNSINEKFVKAIEDGIITDDEFKNISQEIKNFEMMKAEILSKYSKSKFTEDDIETTLKQALIEKGKVQYKEELSRKLKPLLNHN